MIKRFGDFDTTKAFGDGFEQLPRGGYVCKIIGARIEEVKGKQVIKVAFDIAEGEQAGFFDRDYKERAKDNADAKWGIAGTYTLWVPLDDGSEKDSYTKRSFRTFTDALEASNNGYHFDWDEQKFKGKMIGVVFNYASYKTQSGKVGMAPNPASIYSVDKIREGKYKVKDDEYKRATLAEVQAAHDGASSAGNGGGADFVNIPAGVVEELPF